jgi:hypothetical protein
VAGVATTTIEERVRAICMAMPGVTEKVSHGAPAFFVKKQFLHLWVGHHENHPDLGGGSGRRAAGVVTAETVLPSAVRRIAGGWRAPSTARSAISKDAYRVMAPPNSPLSWTPTSRRKQLRQRNDRDDPTTIQMPSLRCDRVPVAVTRRSCRAGKA